MKVEKKQLLKYEKQQSKIEMHLHVNQTQVNRRKALGKRKKNFRQIVCLFVLH